MMKQSILLVDDHRENLIALEAILEAPERQLVMATSGNEALQLALKYDFSLVLLDVQMPEMDGFEVAQLLRQGKKTRNIPIIFVTAISKEHKYVFKGYECGAVDYLFKPIDQQILTAKVEVFLDLDQQKRRLQQAVVQMKRLKDENERLLQAIGEGIVGVDPDGKVSFANGAAATLFGLSRDELVGMKVDALLFNDEDGQRRWDWASSPLLAECSADRPWHSDPPCFIERDGRSVTLDVSATPLNQPGEVFSGVVLVLRDVTAAWLSSAEQQARELRRFTRKKMLREMVMFDRTTGGNVGRLVNISLDGFKLHTRQALEPGTRFSLSMVLPEQMQGVTTLSFDGRCVWSQPQDRSGEFHAGFQIVEMSELHRSVLGMMMEKY
jgi:PAS domain S-box-containing protein